MFRLKCKVNYICEASNIKKRIMQYILEPLETFFQWTFGLLQAGENTPNFIIIFLLMFGLMYWTFFWQKKYNKIAENDPNQLK